MFDVVLPNGASQVQLEVAKTGAERAQREVENWKAYSNKVRKAGAGWEQDVKRSCGRALQLEERVGKLEQEAKDQSAEAERLRGLLQASRREHADAKRQLTAVAAAAAVAAQQFSDVQAKLGGLQQRKLQKPPAAPRREDSPWQIRVKQEGQEAARALTAYVEGPPLSQEDRRRAPQHPRPQQRAAAVGSPPAEPGLKTGAFTAAEPAAADAAAAPSQGGAQYGLDTLAAAAAQGRYREQSQQVILSSQEPLVTV